VDSECPKGGGGDRVSSLLYLLIKINPSSKGYPPSTEIKLSKENVK
jgi:hypothetical protein